MRISPAALWHAKALKIDISLVRGTGPKGFILKSDILQAKPYPVAQEKELQFLVPCSLNEELVKRSISKALSLCSNQTKSSFSYQRIPEFGIQIKFLSNDEKSAEKFKKFLPLLLQDPHYLLL